MAKQEKNKHFFKDFKAELKKVIWPNSKQVINNTIAVVTIVIITAAIVFVLDLVFDMFNSYGINKIKANIKGQDSIVEIQEDINDSTVSDVEENTNNENLTETEEDIQE